MTRPIRVLVGKVGLDGHDRGAKTVALALRNAGFEVVYVGLRQTPEMIVSAALQEDVDAIGISLLSGAHNEVMERICELLGEAGAADMLVILGGNIPERDHARLATAGVDAIFSTSSSFTDIAEWLREHALEATSGKETEVPHRPGR